VTSLVLVPCIASKVSIPVICAGGIANGHGLLAMLALGADGVAMVRTCVSVFIGCTFGSVGFLV
jgi:NAD(P)H-dependent flavin oxidoreductase YrpB (nitropropane dioxygenase family)